jgi:hypothetical protein
MSFLWNAGAYALVIKVDVRSLYASSYGRMGSVQWYTSKLGLVLDQRNSSGNWARLIIPEMPNVTIGLNQNPASGSYGNTGTEVTTFVVSNFQAAVQNLRQSRVNVYNIFQPANGMWLGFFNDPDGNVFGLRQNPPGF